MNSNTRHLLRILSLVSGLFLVLYLALPSHTAGTVEQIKKRGYLLWGSDAEGGAPYVFPDPNNPSDLIGFEVDLARAVAGQMGVTARQAQNSWDSLIPALQRGDFDMAMNGLEITPERQLVVVFSRPYYIYTEQLVVHRDDDRIRDMRDLPGKKVGTLSGAVAHDMLGQIAGVDIRIYSGQAEPYEDLAMGRIDAVLLDLPIAAYYAKPNPKLRYAGPPVGEGVYGIALRKGDEDLRDAVDRAIRNLLQTGELRRIYEKWGLWDVTQERLVLDARSETGAVGIEESRQAPILTFLPTLMKGAVVTVGVSAVSMTFAIVLGLFITLARMYGRPPLSTLGTAYVEIYRGTPLLIQLYILYYGLPSIGVTLSPLAAAVIGLGMNYAAYESEIYRAGLNSVPKGQMEAAQSLGMPQSLALKRIILPQALQISIPGITNDFIALFKDSSLVSVIAMVELTKTYNILAATTLRFFDLGLIVALLYFGMSYPMSLLARRLEERLKGGSRP